MFSCFVGFRLNGELVVDMERCFRKAANDMWFVNTRGGGVWRCGVGVGEGRNLCVGGNRVGRRRSF